MGKKGNGMKSSSASKLMDTVLRMSKEGYVSLPVRQVFGDRSELKESQWKGVYNAALSSPASSSGTDSVSYSVPVGNEIKIASGGTEGLGYMTWGPDDRLPNHIALLASLLPYTAVGVKFNADVIAGLGPKPKYRYSRYSNGTIQTEQIDYASAGAFIQGQLLDKRNEVFKFLKENDTMVSGGEAYKKQIIEHLNSEISKLEYELETWKHTNDELEKFMRNNNLDLLFTSLAIDISLMGICFPELQLDRQASNENDATWSPKIIGMNYHDCATCRLERMDDQGRINYVYVSNRWLDKGVHVSGIEGDIASIPALDTYRPLQSLEEKVRDTRLRAYSGKKGKDGKQKSERPVHFVLPSFYPSAGRKYYPEPAWYSIFRGDIYKYTSTIIENRRIAKENSNSAGKIIYIHTEYLASLFMQREANTLDEKDKLRDQMWNEINQFLKDKENNGQTILSFTFLGSDGKEHDAWRIVDVPINSKVEADANKTELEELSNIIFLALGIHSVLIGNSIGSSSSGGTQQREMYEMKKVMSVPTQRILLKPLYIVRDFNGWDSHLEWEIGQMTLTTLDRNKNGIEETKV